METAALMDMKTETAKAELSKLLINQNDPSPIKSLDDTKYSLTYFWWDNFDCKKENLAGSLHTTHGVAFLLQLFVNK